MISTTSHRPETENNELLHADIEALISSFIEDILF